MPEVTRSLLEKYLKRFSQNLQKSSRQALALTPSVVPIQTACLSYKKIAFLALGL
jgi:hypothetical protein